MKTIEIETYKSVLTEKETEQAIALLKSKFISLISDRLNLIKVEAPLIVQNGTGINDDLNGIENPVFVKAKGIPNKKIEIVHSLAKWKRLKLAKLGAKEDEGLYTDMRALRPDEDFSEIHSIYVDQWDWEKVISEENRSLQYLKKIVNEIYAGIVASEVYITSKYSQLKTFLPKEIEFIHSEDLLALYPGLSPKERENAIVKEKGAVFLIGIGGVLADGKKHDGRAPDYDDWSTETIEGKRGLNGDILVWNPILEKSFELSSMGIRVSPQSLKQQLQIEGEEKRLELKWHTLLLNNKLPYTIGGGIGQSRLAMLLLQKKHIGEVQSSIWPTELIEELKLQNINLL